MSSLGNYDDCAMRSRLSEFQVVKCIQKVQVPFLFPFPFFFLPPLSFCEHVPWKCLNIRNKGRNIHAITKPRSRQKHCTLNNRIAFFIRSVYTHRFLAREGWVHSQDTHKSLSEVMFTSSVQLARFNLSREKGKHLITYTMMSLKETC